MACVEMRYLPFILKEEYYQNEKLFSKEIIAPLLKNMGFYSVIYHHGINEFGKDFILTRLNPFGYYEYIGVQVKIGDLDGKANSKIDEIITQIDDCFEIPYLDIKTKEYKLISSFVLIISGHLTENAKIKIMNKLHGIKKASTTIIDRDEIEALIEKYMRNKDKHICNSVINSGN